MSHAEKPQEPAQDEAVDLIAASLMPGQRDVLHLLFRHEGAREPVVVWSPQPRDLGHPLLGRFAELCDGMRREDGLLTAQGFDLEAFGTLKDWVMLVAPDGSAFRYNHYGRGIAEHYGHDMTGRTTADFTGHVQTFFEAVYRAATERREPVLTEHEPPTAVFVRTWRRLIEPVFAPDGDAIAYFAVINLPENELRAGLDLIADPVFVLDGTQKVHYANDAARKTYKLGPLQAPGATLGALAGLDLGNLPPISEVLTDPRIADQVAVTQVAGMVERQRITVNAAEHRGRLFYVILVQPMDV